MNANIKRVRKRQTLLVGVPTDRFEVLPPQGILIYDGKGKLQCHICGHWYKSLPTHVRLAHNVTADEYRGIYGLNRTQPLCPPELSAKLSRLFINRGLAGMAGNPKGREYLEKHRGNTRGLHTRLQARVNISNGNMGKEIPLTAKRLRSQRANLIKMFQERPCSLCGKLVLSNKGFLHVYCDDGCRKKGRKIYMRKWRENNREHSREYMRQWQSTHRKGVLA
jgi:hypothetical protein